VIHAPRHLRAGAGLDIYLAGGATLAGALVDEIDELVIKLYPVVAGSGVPLLSDAGFAPRGWSESVRRLSAPGT
jgi:dihydrofolate reductase